MAIMAAALSGCSAIGLGGSPPALETPVFSPTEPPTAQTATPAATASPGEMSWEDLTPTVSDSVVRLQIAGCDGAATSMGSGFVVGPHEVMTAAHVVDDAPTITVRSSQGLTRARVIAFDTHTDSALLRTDEAFEGEAVPLSTRLLALGRDLAVFGYPLAVNDLQVSTGVVSGLDQAVTYPADDITVDHVFVTDAATNPGNSGGPVFDRTGRVVGLVSGGTNWDSNDEATRRPVQGRNYIVPASSLIPNLDAWSGLEPEDAELCNGDTETDNDGSLKVSVHSDHPSAEALAQALFVHGESINTGDYEAAWSVFSPAFQRSHPLKSWAPGHETSFWVSLDLLDVTGTGGRLTVSTRFQTVQDAEYGHDGQTCSIWDRSYVMVLVGGVWRIDSTHGAAPTAC